MNNENNETTIEIQLETEIDHEDTLAFSMEEIEEAEESIQNINKTLNNTSDPSQELSSMFSNFKMEIEKVLNQELEIDEDSQITYLALEIDEKLSELTENIEAVKEVIEPLVLLASEDEDEALEEVDVNEEDYDESDIEYLEEEKTSH